MNDKQPEWIESYLRKEDEEGYVPFNEDRRLGQNQYASRYAHDRLGGPDLGQGLRWKDLDSSSYHDIRIHKDDLLTFHQRVERYRKDVLQGNAREVEHYLEG